MPSVTTVKRYDLAPHPMSPLRKIRNSRGDGSRRGRDIETSTLRLLRNHVDKGNFVSRSRNL